MSTRHLTFDLRKHRKYWRMLTFSSVTSPIRSHGLPAPIRATHPVSRTPSSDRTCATATPHPIPPIWSPTQRQRGPDRESAGPRHRERWEKTAGPRHRPRQRTLEPDTESVGRGPPRSDTDPDRGRQGPTQRQSSRGPTQRALGEDTNRDRERRATPASTQRDRRGLTQSTAPRQRERRALTQRAPGPDTEPRHGDWRATTQRPPGPETQRQERTATPRHRPRQGFLTSCMGLWRI